MKFKELELIHENLVDPDSNKIALSFLYERVVGFKIIDVNDVVRLAVLCYGWMPTMNKGRDISHDIDLIPVRDCLIEIQKTKSRRKAIRIAFSRMEICKDFLSLTNSSVVGLSKALHIIRPDVFPIIDSHLLNALRRYGRYIDFPDNEIPSCKHPTRELIFFEYFTMHLCDHMSNIPVRKVEKILYDLGQLR